MSQRFTLSRRATLGGATALAAGAAFPAAAQDNKRIVIGTWGGDYSRLLAKNIETPLLVPKGWDVVKDEAGDPPRRAKVVAEKALRRGTSDIQAVSAVNMYEMNEQGTIDQIDYAKISNAANLLPAMKYPYGVGHIYSGKVILFNPKLVSTPPTSFADTLDPKHGNKLGIIDIQYQYTMMAAGLASGGSMTNFDPGKERLIACKKAGARIYPSNEALAQALKTEEIALCIMWKARAVQWQNAGINVETVAAKEGVPMFVSGFVVPKNAPNKAGSYAFLDAMLNPAAQEGFAVDMGYNPTVTNAKMAPDVQKRVGFTDEEKKRLIDLDYAYMAKNDSAFKEWWDKSFKG
jgi:putative spermidine/putrescine transport system substrate-binding protein